MFSGPSAKQQRVQLGEKDPCKKDGRRFPRTHVFQRGRPPTYFVRFSPPPLFFFLLVFSFSLGLNFELRYFRPESDYSARIALLLFSLAGTLFLLYFRDARK